MTLFITSDTLFHSQKYFLALVVKVKFTPPQPTGPQPPPVKWVRELHSLTHTHSPKVPADRWIHCQNSYYKAHNITEIEGSLETSEF